MIRNKALLLLAIILFYACSQNAPATIPESSNNLSSPKPYKPGLGEIMSGIQMHHAKLWFAGINSNWELSKYEIDEIRELFQTAKDFETDRTEVGNIPLIYGDLDSVSNAIERQNLELFKNSFQSLTHTCNSCHRTVHFEFNVITIPTTPPVSNQDFKKISN